METNLQKQLGKFYAEMEHNIFGGLLIFIPEYKQFVKISYGTGANLSAEDKEEGFDDYLYVEVDEFDGQWQEDVDGAMMLLKIEKEHNGHHNICQHIEEGLKMLYDSVPEVIILQSFTH